MQKDQYLALKEKRQIDISLAYEMYNDIEHKSPKIPMSDFIHIFPMWITMTGSNCEKFWEYFDKKFEIV